MTSIQPIQDDRPWQLQLPPEKWTEILQQALRDHRANPGDTEALQAIKDANEALNTYDAASSVGPRERIESGAREGIEGLAQAGGDIGRGLKNLVTNPVESLKNLIPNLIKMPGEMYEGITSDDQSQVARTVGHLGAMFAPGGRTGMKTGRMASSAGKRTVAGAVAEGVGAPTRAVGELLKTPGLKNRLLEEQTKRAALSEEALRQLIDERLARQGPRQAILEEQAAQAPLRTEVMAGQAARAPIQTEQAGMRSTRMEQQNAKGQQDLVLGEAKLQRIPDDMELSAQRVDRGAPMLENLELRNELLRRQLEELVPDAAAATAPSAATGIGMADRSAATASWVEDMMKSSASRSPVSKGIKQMGQTETIKKIGKAKK